MNNKTYLEQFEQILNGENTLTPYDDPAYINYVKLNYSRIKRWRKTLNLDQSLTNVINGIKDRQTWVLITEPWCGDAANSHVIVTKLAELNSNITLVIQNRDSKGSEIEHYLTNGGKAIPKLIVRNSSGKDIFIWGPRPKAAQEFLNELKTTGKLTLEEMKIELQNWYNSNQGKDMQNELLKLFETNQ